MSKPKALDLFCGAGGLSLGLIDAGFAVVGGVDYDKPSIATYKRNFEHPALCADLARVEPASLLEDLGLDSADIHLLAGGPPCQGFSVQRRGGDRDDRNELLLRFLHFVEVLRPPFFLLENVPGMQTRHGARMIHQFKTGARAAGYAVKSAVLNAADFGVPQIRRRIFIIGELEASFFSFPSPTLERQSWKTVRDALDGLPAPPADFTPHPEISNHQLSRMSALNIRRIAHVPEGGGWQHLPEELRLACHRPGADKIGHRYVYGRLSWDEPAGTITARFDSFTRGKFAHPTENRSITLREGARLQSFPDTFVFEGTKEEVAAQIGNAVPPRLAKALGESLLAAYRHEQPAGEQISLRFSSGVHDLNRTYANDASK